MKAKYALRSKLTLFLCLIVFPTIAAVTLLFYSSFKDALSERIDLHLTSIRKLKKVQVEQYLRQKEREATLILEKGYPISKLPKGDSIVLRGKNIPASPGKNLGVWEEYTPGQLVLASKAWNADTMMIYLSHLPKLESILVERTGMGRTGETYLVGPDAKMRSKSRFMEDENPMAITVETEGVRKSLLGQEGSSVFLDYRGVEVYSAFAPLKIGRKNWAILSEIDVYEGQIPVRDLRYRLILIVITAGILVGIIGFFAATSFLKPLVLLKNKMLQMSKGAFTKEQVGYNGATKEVGQMYEALYALIDSVSGAIDYANQMSMDNIQEPYKPKSPDDALGHALVAMNFRIKEFHEQEQELHVENQRSLIKGQENEHLRLSKELSTSFTPLLHKLKINLEATELEDSKKRALMADVIAAETALLKLTQSLTPQELLEQGIGPALAQCTNHIENITDLEVDLQMDLLESTTCSEEKKIALYRVVQEILQSSAENENASKATVSVAQIDNSIQLKATNNGSAQDFKESLDSPGMKVIKERMRMLGGSLDVKSDSEETSLEISLPLEA